jgi:hypothetical protein
MKMTGEHQGHGMGVFPGIQNQCVWTKAGVVDCRICENAFDCTSCSFDKEISRQSRGLTGPFIWKKVMRQQGQKECRHMLTGRVLFKLCSHDYNCNDCAYDQFLYESDQLLGEVNHTYQVEIAAA